MPDTSVDVVVPVFNQMHLTARFILAAWGKAVAHHSASRLIIVDNGSTDGTADWVNAHLEQMGGQLVLVQSMENLGFGGGNNLGLAASFADQVIFTSNDVLVDGDFVAPVVRYLNQQPGSLVGAEYLDYDTGWNVFQDEDGERVQVDYLAGWFVAATAGTWAHLEGWDTRFFPCDYEDLDLSYRARREGIPLVRLHLPLRHEFGQTASRMSWARETVTLQSQVRFMEKWGLTRV